MEVEMTISTNMNLINVGGFSYGCCIGFSVEGTSGAMEPLFRNDRTPRAAPLLKRGHLIPPHGLKF